MLLFALTLSELSEAVHDMVVSHPFFLFNVMFFAIPFSCSTIKQRLAVKHKTMRLFSFSEEFNFLVNCAAC
jgi:hypothetical protein